MKKSSIEVLFIFLILKSTCAFPKIKDSTLRLGSRNRDALNDSSASKIDGNETEQSDSKTPTPATFKLGNENIEHDTKISHISPDIKLGYHACIYSKHNSIEHSTLESTEVDDDGSDYDDKFDTIPKLKNITLPGIGSIQIEICEPQAEYCYAIWEENSQDGHATILGQGCWVSSDNQKSCSSGNVCRSDLTRYRIHQNTKFCCCEAGLCNAETHSEPLILVTSSPTEISSASPATINISVKESIILGVGACFLGILLIIIAWVTFKYTRGKNVKIEGNISINNYDSGGPGFSCSTTCVDNLKLHDNIGSGRYSKVWRGSLGGVPVAVKALPASQSTLWAREKDVYCLPHMRHSNILQYFGCDTRPTLDGPPEHLLVLQLAPLGSLKKYLIENTLDWDTYTNMALGIASALAHLHTHIEKDGQYKPCVIHRDINSSNVLVRADLSCCLGDLGLAMPIPDTNTQTSQIQYRIQEAGTLRYLAPEALEGSLDLRRCAASLRAVDVYALALVLWELLSRCTTLYRSPGPPPYVPPFQTEIGDHPTLEKMQVLIAKRKARPLFSPRLLPFRATRLARDTCEDCWDHDAEARLTAVCVVERLSELKTMRPATSPTINSNDLRPPSQDGMSNHHSPVSCEDKNSNITSSIISNSNNVSNVIDYKANIMQKLPLQPHQGRNPCMERNLASVEQDDRLYDKSLKDMPSSSLSASLNGYGANFSRTEDSALEPLVRSVPHDFSRLEEQNTNSSGSGHTRNINRQQNTLSSHHDPIFNGNIEDDQMLNDFRHLTRPLTPIGYVQNDVSSDLNGIIVTNNDCNPYGYPAKRCNVPLEPNQPKWGPKRLKMYLDSKIFKKKTTQNKPVPLETEVNLVLSNGKPVNNGVMNSGSGKFKTSIIINDTKGKINKDNYNFIANEGSAGRPSSLPGLDSVVSNGTVSTECSSGENTLPETIRERCRNNLQNDTYNITPPNQTVSCNMLSKPDDKIDSNLVVGYKEFPNNSDVCVDSANQIFAVIVPKPSYHSNSDHLNCNGMNSLNHSNVSMLSNKPIEISKKVESILVTSDNADNTEAKSYGGKFAVSDCNNLYENRNDMKTNKKLLQNRNSYSGEFEIRNFSDYNKENDQVDYSSNSEDEHMLLLSENGGSKITMRQRYDVKPNRETKANKKNRQMSSSHSVQENGNGLSKIAAESFSSLCNKYGAKSKYENLLNESSDAKEISTVKDTAFLNHRNVRLSLSICKQNNDDGDFINFDGTNNIEDRLNGDGNEEVSSDDDASFPDEVFLKKSPNSFRPLSIKQNLSRQHSLELVSELFSSSADLTRLKDPANRIKTPGDVPPSVRKMRGSIGASKIRRTGSARESTKTTANRLSLYDDRMMFGNSL